MKRYFLDTDTITHYLRHHTSVIDALIRHLQDEIAITIINIEEIWDGWQNSIRKSRTPEELGNRYERLAETINEIRYWKVVPFDRASVEEYVKLKRLKLNIGSNDLKIAAISLKHQATLVTRNEQDFKRVPGLITENWID